MTAALLREPHWSGAARALVSGCIDLRQEDDQVALLEQVCRALGSALYPAFLRVLTEVGQHGDPAARASVARALVIALRSGRLPSGRLGGWGGLSASSSQRTLGPLEYLCVSLEQEPGERAQQEFLRAAESLMVLVSADDEARQLYGRKLLADAAQPLEGAMSRTTRRGLEAMATAWLEGEGPSLAAQRFIEALSSGPHGLQALMGAAPKPGAIKAIEKVLRQ